MVAPELPYESELTRINGLFMHIVHAGPKDGPLVILLHGFPEFWYGWRGQIDPLTSQGFRLMIPDQRGYNRSDKPGYVGEYVMQQLVDDVVSLIHHAGKDRAMIVGHDWGGIVAWWTALRYPDRVEKLAVLNAPHPLVMSRNLRRNPRQMLMSWYTVAFQVPWLPERLIEANGYKIFANAIKRSARRDSFSAADMQKYREAWSQPGAMQAMLNWYRAYVQRGPQLPDDSRIKAPTLLIWGAQDFALNTGMAQPSIDLCDDGKLVKIDKATHWVQHDATEQVNESLIDFLRE